MTVESGDRDEKRCFKCGVVKTRVEFYRHSKMADGLLGKCKSCTKSDVSANYLVNKPRYRKYERRREQSLKRKFDKLAQQRKRRRDHPEKARAYAMVHRAIKSGKLVRLPCRVCGNRKSEGHHSDYSKPLEVDWLCFSCHRAEHGQDAS